MLREQRERIDQLDQQIVALLEERFAVSLEVGAIKAQHQLPVLDAEREQKIIHLLRDKVTNPIFEEAIIQVYQTLMDASKTLQTQHHEIKE